MDGPRRSMSAAKWASATSHALPRALIGWVRHRGHLDLPRANLAAVRGPLHMSGFRCMLLAVTVLVGQTKVRPEGAGHQTQRAPLNQHQSAREAKIRCMAPLPLAPSKAAWATAEAPAHSGAAALVPTTTNCSPDGRKPIALLDPPTTTHGRCAAGKSKRMGNKPKRRRTRSLAKPPPTWACQAVAVPSKMLSFGTLMPMEGGPPPAISKRRRLVARLAHAADQLHVARGQGKRIPPLRHPQSEVPEALGNDPPSYVFITTPLEARPQASIAVQGAM